MNQFLLKVKILLLILILCCTDLSAQVNMIYNANTFGKSVRELAYLQIFNSSTNNYSGSLIIEIKNLSGTGSFVKLFVKSVNVNPGINILPAAKLSSSVITYANSTEGNYVRQTSLMPEGELEYCFRLVLSSKNNPDEIYENCFFRTNILSSPMQLVSPDNSDEFCDKRPRFTWQPPLPLSPTNSFSLKLVQVEEDQSPVEALMVNTPVIYQANIRGYILPFPAGIADLKVDQLYAWQVTANDNGKQSVSEVWSFHIKCQKEVEVERSYRELKFSDDGGFLSTGSSLKFAVNNPYIEGALNYQISDLTKPNKTFKRLPSIYLQKGANNILIDLKKIPGIEDDHEYSLTVILPDGRKVSLRFKYQDL